MLDQNKKDSTKLCGYCGRPPETPICRVPELHVLPLMNKKTADEIDALHR